MYSENELKWVRLILCGYNLHITFYCRGFGIIPMGLLVNYYTINSTEYS